MKKFNLLSWAEMKKVMGGVFELESIDSAEGGGDSPKISACIGKKRRDECYFDYKGVTYGGHCDSHMASALYCSTLI